MAFLLVVFFAVAAVLTFKLIGSLLAFCILIALAAVIGVAAESLVPNRLPFGSLGTLAAALLGASLGTALMSSVPPLVAGVAILPAVVCAVLVAVGALYILGD
jgi:uncharacterized membrane protein YeaQ/YmgE (transglycosylase-associated protein family)